MLPGGGLPDGGLPGDALLGGAPLYGVLLGGGADDTAAGVTGGANCAGVLPAVTAGPAAVPAAGVVALVAAVSSPWDERRRSIHPTMIMLTTSNPAMAIAHTGNRDFGGATLTSNSAGPDCRCRSLSDFFSASRMNDIVQPPWASAR
jgi:hypothetical protein